MKKRIAVVCPGRGSYTKENLGSFAGPNANHPLLKQFDALRSQDNLPTLSELDSAQTFRTSLHTKGEHASPLITACSWLDFLSIDQNRYEVVALTGNSMGWYLALAFSGGLDTQGAYTLIQTMGSMMKEKLIGGQIIYPIVDEHWRISQEVRSMVTSAVAEANRPQDGQAYISIELGGYLVIGGNALGLSHLMKALPPKEHYPFQLINHGAFHTPLLKEVSQKAFSQIPSDIFKAPEIPLVDGRGHIWQPYATNLQELYEYTLGHQVSETYNFTSAITTTLKEFAPDHIVLLGPGNSLGGAIGQTLIMNEWKGLQSKDEFSLLQTKAPFLLSMGVPAQKKTLISKVSSTTAPTNSGPSPRRF